MDCFDMHLFQTLFLFLLACPASHSRSARLSSEFLDGTFTQKIVTKLGFNPVAHNSSYMEKVRNSLPKPITNRINRGNAFQPTAAPDFNREAMVVGEHLEGNCLQGLTSACFVLRVAENIRQLRSATLWIDLKVNPAFAGHTFTINEVRMYRDGAQIRERIGDRIVLPRYFPNQTKSVDVDMTAIVHRWSRHAAVTNRHIFSRAIAVICTDCTFSGDSPVDEDRVILELSFYQTSRRNKRGSQRTLRNECGSIPTNCCLQRYTLNFRRVGWHTWVVYPPEFTPNYCMGSCEGGNILPHTQHASMLASAVRKLANLSERQRNAMLPCCAPTSMGSFTLMYLDPRGRVRLNQMSNLVAYDCGCM